jgi:ribosomal protein L12E/L44/L45/RPP1/RPP2
VAEQARIDLSAVDRTQAAFASLQANLGKAQSGVAALGARFGAIGLAISSALGAISFKGAIDAGDQLNKLSQKTGIAVESLSALKFAGALTDVSVEDLATGIRKLGNNMASAAGGSKEAQAAFAAIGVSVKTAGGALRNTDDVLADVADKFAGYEDGAAKAALATELFGKNGVALIPFLNAGRKGLAEMRDEAQKLGVTFSADLAKQTEEFNDNLTRLGQAADGFKVQILGAILPSLVKLTDGLVDARKAYGGFLSAFLDQSSQNPFSALDERMANTRTELAKLRESLGQIEARNQSTSFVDKFNSIGSDRQAEKLRDQIALLEKRDAFFKATQQREALALGSGVQDERRFRGPARVQAPIIDRGAGDRAQAILKAQLGDRIKQLEAGLAAERDALQFHQRYLDQVYDAWQLSAQQFYAARSEAAQRALDAQLAILDQEAAALRRFQGQATDPKERASTQGQINEVLAKQAKLRQDAAQEAVLGAAQEQKAVERLAEQYQDLQATLLQLQGDEFGATALRNAQQVAQAEKLLAQAGGDRAVAGRIATALDQQNRFAQIREQVAEVSRKAAAAEEYYVAAAERGGASLAETERGIYALRSDSLAQLEALRAKLDELAAASNNPEITKFAEELGRTAKRATQELDPALARLQEASKQLGQGIAGTFENAIVNGGKFGDVLKDIEAQILRTITNLLITQPLAKALEQSFANIGQTAGLGSSTSGAQSGGGGTNALLSTIGNLFSRFFGGGSSGFGSGSSFGNQDLGLFLHSGGVAGAAGGAWRPVGALAWAGAERYHRGGIAGLQADEVPAVLRRGEEVLTQSDPRHRNNATERGSSGPTIVNQTFNTTGAIDTRTRLQIMADAQVSLGRARRNL